MAPSRQCNGTTGRKKERRSNGWAECRDKSVGSAGINRYEAEDERALRERSNEPLGPEFCDAYREVHSEA